MRAKTKWILEYYEYPQGSLEMILHVAFGEQCSILLYD